MTTSTTLHLTAEQRDAYAQDGYVVLPAVFTEQETAEMAAESDRLVDRGDDLAGKLRLWPPLDREIGRPDDVAARDRAREQDGLGRIDQRAGIAQRRASHRGAGSLEHDVEATGARIE